MEQLLRKHQGQKNVFLMKVSKNKKNTDKFPKKNSLNVTKVFRYINVDRVNRKFYVKNRQNNHTLRS